jgi:thiamine-phosphate pyrophosphorylase
MELIVVSSSRQKEGEAGDVIRMFEAGLTRFHLRKPGVSKKYIKDFIEQIPRKYRKQIVIHSNHSFAFTYGLGGIHISKKHRKKKFRLRMKIMWYRIRKPGLIITRSCHKLGDLTADRNPYSYVLLSPIYDSISANSLSASFNRRGLTNTIAQSPHKVIAMGGAEPGKFQEIADLGFSGAAVLGYIWRGSGDRVALFQQCMDSWRKVV